MDPRELTFPAPAFPAFLAAAIGLIGIKKTPNTNQKTNPNKIEKAFPHAVLVSVGWFGISGEVNVQ